MVSNRLASTSRRAAGPHRRAQRGTPAPRRPLARHAAWRSSARTGRRPALRSRRRASPHRHRSPRGRSTTKRSGKPGRSHRSPAAGTRTRPHARPRCRLPARPRLRLLLRTHQPRRDQPPQAPPPLFAAQSDRIPVQRLQRGDLRGTLRRLRQAGISANEVHALLARICVSPVFTAHPTEVARRSVMFKRRRISDLLEQLDRIPVPEPHLEALERDLLAEITALWQTDDVRSARPTVRDEIRMALDYYESSLFDTLPVLYAEVAAALAAEYPNTNPCAPAEPATSLETSPPSICELPAGPLRLLDRRRPRRQPLRHPRKPRAKPSPWRTPCCSPTTAAACRTSSSSSPAPPSRSPSPPSSTALLDRYLTQLRTAGQNALEERFPYESVRLLIACIMMRLGATPQSAVPVPREPGAHALHPRRRAARRPHRPARLARRATAASASPRCSSIRCCSRSAPTACTCRRSTSASTRASTPPPSPRSPHGPTQALPDRSPSPPPSPPQTAEVLDTFRAIAELKQTYSPESIRQYVISGATSAEDVLHVLWLARLGGVKVEAPRRRRPNPTPASSPCRSSSPSKTSRTPPPSAASSGPAKPTSRCSNPGTTTRRSCSATPTPTRTAA